MIDEMPEDVQVKAWFENVEALRGLDHILGALPGMTGMDLGALTISHRACRSRTGRNAGSSITSPSAPASAW